MTSENDLFRWLFTGIFVATFSMSAYFRREARRSTGVISRAREGKAALAARLFFAAPLYLSILAYMLNPRWMAWSSFDASSGARWLGVAIALTMVAVLYWVLTSIGANISETTLTKTNHRLVTHGPYRWVRHPLYAAATTAFVALGLVAANWFIMAFAFAASVLVAFVVIPREEARLTQRFGEDYRHYISRTGALIPRLRR